MTFIPQRVTGTPAAGAHPGSYNGQDAYNDMLIPFVKVVRSGARDKDGNLPPEVWREEQTNPTLTQFDQGDTRTTTAVVFHPHFSDGARPQPDGKSPACTAFWGTGGNNGTMVAQPTTTPDLAVRRLTPLECERLQGFPDNHTLHRADGKTNSDSTRYKQCGNGVATPVAAWIAKHLRNLL